MCMYIRKHAHICDVGSSMLTLLHVQALGERGFTMKTKEMQRRKQQAQAAGGCDANLKVCE